MGRPFSPVAVQKCGHRALMQHGVQLPHQIGRVAQALAHPLTQKGRLLMRGITGQKHPAIAPALRHEGVKTVAG
jgi:hypothetical protein